MIRDNKFRKELFIDKSEIKLSRYIKFIKRIGNNLFPFGLNILLNIVKKILTNVD